MVKSEQYYFKIKDMDRAYNCWQFRNYLSCSGDCDVCPFKNSYVGVNSRIDLGRLIYDSQKEVQFLGKIIKPIMELDKKDEKRKD